ncbi:MAG TPA: GNAT family N-acetyltransferase [Terracidiphilus sp.]|jgi:predicted N-acetyltransferase YhbS|nr:GNAT family N-acetyltransferase [Terracidiphilus sp.]
MTSPNPSEEILIRPMEPHDAESAAALALQLGYTRTPAAVRQWIEDQRNRNEQAALVACQDAQVVGWIEVSVQRHLQSEPYTLITGLVVSETVRGKGIGRRLCRSAEQWSWDIGVPTVRVTSRSSRLDAHRFYRDLGYCETKTSLVFEKKRGE